MTLNSSSKTAMVSKIFWLQVFSIWIGLGGVGCTNRKDFIKSLDQKPIIWIKVGDSLRNFYQDSIKLNPTLNNFSSVNLTFSAKEGVYALNYVMKAGIGSLEYKGDSNLNGSLNTAGENTIVKFIPKGEGLSVLYFIVKDRFLGVDTAIYQVLSFKNLSPIANFILNPIKIKDPFEYEFDASASLDPDVHYGGGITQYKFTVNGQNIFSATPRVSYIFPGAGKYEVKLQVTDNDLTVSPVYLISVIIN